MYGISALLAVILLQFFMEDADKVPAPVCFVGVPLLAVLFTMVLAITNGKRLKGIFTVFGGNEDLGPGAVKECVDRLPMGIFCYYPDGRVKLVNNVMSGLVVRMSGDSFLDGNTLKNELKKRSLDPISGMSHIIRTDDDRIYNFQEKGIMFDGKPLYEILANDVTKEYALTEALREKEKSVAQLNGKLKELADETLKTAIEKEVLDAKIKVHDNFGRVILFTRRYLRDRGNSFENTSGNAPEDITRNIYEDTSGNASEDVTRNIYEEAEGNASEGAIRNISEDAARIASEIRQQTTLLKNESPDEWRRDYDYVYRTARLLGVKIDLYGELPSSGKQEKLAVSALSCTLLNSARHAGADRMIVAIRQVKYSSDRKKTDDILKGDDGELFYEMRITDNGRTTNGPIIEKGGLVNLRRELENEGGQLNIEYEHGVVVNVVIPAQTQPGNG
ncbi:MAG: hypothetical protein K6E62_14380 [Lachnospiraceae bacterium]|nr:hypothetical protein [Lachnospiraceae bacterium]